MILNKKFPFFIQRVPLHSFIPSTCIRLHLPYVYKSEKSFFSMKVLKMVPLGERHVVLTDHIFNERAESTKLTLPISPLSDDAQVLHH